MLNQFWMKFLSHRTNTCTVNSLQWNSIRHSLCFFYLTSAENNTPPHLRAIRVETCLRLGIWLQIIFNLFQSHFHFWLQSDVLAIYIHTPTYMKPYISKDTFMHTYIHSKSIYLYILGSSVLGVAEVYPWKSESQVTFFFWAKKKSQSYVISLDPIKTTSDRKWFYVFSGPCFWWISRLRWINYKMTWEVW